MIITNEAMFNKQTLNIFTDASITKNVYMNEEDGMYIHETVGCAGAIVAGILNTVDTKETDLVVVDNALKIVRNSTSNNSEIEAVKLGIHLALRHRQHNPNIKTINLLSDSKLCIYGLREWIFNWVRDSVNDSLIGSTGQQVANQDTILQIIYMILNNDLSINLYHQNGHININKPDDLERAGDTFINSNFLMDEVDIDVIKSISIANNYIDNITRQHLTSVNIDDFHPGPSPISFIYTEFDIDKYARLLNLCK